jgi:membrane protein implicated in regulation of membrane protease activity
MGGEDRALDRWAGQGKDRARRRPGAGCVLRASRANHIVKGIAVASPVENTCDKCQEPARVHILEEYEKGTPLFRHLCLSCADALSEETARGSRGTNGNRASMASILIMVGIFFGIVGMASDYIGISRGSGFGWLRLLGLLVGVLFVLVGALIRVDAIGVAGSIILGLTACVSLFGLSQVSGIGWKQQLAMTVGLLLILTGVLLKRWVNRETGEDDGRLTREETGLQFDGELQTTSQWPNKGGAA